MKVFISWSGKTSEEVAKVLKECIPCVIQSVEPYFSSADIDKGARWSNDIAKELQDASFGILCVTKENLFSAWLNFEAGALSKSMDQSKVCPFLFDLKPSDIQNSPILQFQMTSTNKDEVFKLFKSINANLNEKKLNDELLSKAFEAFWPTIDEKLRSISSKVTTPTQNKKDKENEQAPIEEILELIRYQHKLLKSPEELLPPQYLQSILNINRMVPRNIMMDIDENIHIIDVIINEMIENCTIRSTNDSKELVADNLPCISRLQNIQSRLHRLKMLFRKFSRNSDFII